MTFAWYGHLKFKSTALVTVILVRWGIAFFEYCLMVPANRIGYGHFIGSRAEDHPGGDHPVGFRRSSRCFYLKEPLTWNYLLGFAFIAAGAFFIFHKWA